MENQLQPVDNMEVSEDSEAVRHLKGAIAQGRHWYIALLEAIGLWDKTEETYDGRHYRYLIANEAFDWLLLAERLLREVGHIVPEKEIIALLFFGKAPIQISSEEFRQCVGEAKYGAHLNYFYGITVEEALLLAVEEKVRKEQHVYAVDGNHLTELAYEQIYGATMASLLLRFQREKGYPQRKSMELAEFKEFTYWLFKYRLNNCDKERVASDTKMAIHELKRQWGLVKRKKALGGAI
jgi:hypothetical protein